MAQPLPEDRLRARAREVAAPVKTALTEQPDVHLVALRTGQNQYAVPTQAVCEVIPAPPITALPGLPRGLTGVFNYRGQLLGMLDLDAWLHDQPAATPEQVLVIDWQTCRFGLAAPNGTETLACSDETLSTRTAPWDPESEGRFTHVLLRPDEPLLVLDLKSLTGHFRPAPSPGSEEEKVS